MYGYIYKTTNLKNGKIYIGQHKGDYELGIDNDYLGSGKYISRAINKYGKENFKLEIIEWCQTYEIQNEREKFWINKAKSLYTNGNYNLTLGGCGGSSVGSENVWSREGRIRNNIPNFWIGRHHSKETKLKIGKSKKGQIPPNKGKKLTEEEKQEFIYNRTFNVKCSCCGKTIISNASGTKYCESCKIKREIDYHTSSIHKIKSGNCSNKQYFIDQRIKKIRKLEKLLSEL